MELIKAYKFKIKPTLDHLHKATTSIVRENQVIVIEDLNSSGMLRNRKLAKSIADVSFRKVRDLLSYKAKLYGRELIVIDRFFPSSKLCSECGFRNDSLTLSDREWVCPSCGKRLDRDLNAANNILAEGLRLKKSG